ncbi:MAG: bifunctional 5,10-methylenetetrahydrofolate dehydrogenase/5,10-methenyltetrahydrofolate cyclohydrolase [Oscillospiraceae bacterium]|nr:bifunctional 5,10-methylenetetrahydrofolate dehydrogenase/5,10-methenyltetrahydrofolate cyclohydrolase [Oscillospiraceae bacterium]
MAVLLKGAPVATAINARSKETVFELQQHSIIPTLAIVRVGERPDDLSYERNAMKRCASVGVKVRNIVFPEEVSQEEFYGEIDRLNQDDTVHGVLIFRPLPKHLDNEKARNAVIAEKDVDGCTDLSLAGVFTGSGVGFAPCTAQAVMEVLSYYGISVEGKDAVVVGRSLVVGRPVSLLLMRANATVTVCHTKTNGLSEKAKRADILVACSGQMESIGRDYIREGQTVLDVGISWNEEKQKLCGDVLFEEAERVVDAITPVPGGIGSVTTSVLVSHVVESAKRRSGFMF